MDFELSEDQRLLVDTVASFVKKDSPVERLRKLRDERARLGQARRLAEDGRARLARRDVPRERRAALGVSFVDVGLILEQLGTTLVPEPYHPAARRGSALLAAGSAEQQQRVPRAAVAGDESLALAYAEQQSRYDRSTWRRAPRKIGAGLHAHGQEALGAERPRAPITSS